MGWRAGGLAGWRAGGRAQAGQAGQARSAQLARAGQATPGQRALCTRPRHRTAHHRHSTADVLLTHTRACAATPSPPPPVASANSALLVASVTWPWACCHCCADQFSEPLVAAQQPLAASGLAPSPPDYCIRAAIVCASDTPATPMPPGTPPPRRRLSFLTTTAVITTAQ